MIDPCLPVVHSAETLRAWGEWALSHPWWHASARVAGKCGKAAAVAAKGATVALPFVVPGNVMQPGGANQAARPPAASPGAVATEAEFPAGLSTVGGQRGINPYTTGVGSPGLLPATPFGRPVVVEGGVVAGTEAMGAASSPGSVLSPFQTVLAPATVDYMPIPTPAPEPASAWLLLPLATLVVAIRRRQVRA